MKLNTFSIDQIPSLFFGEVLWSWLIVDNTRKTQSWPFFQVIAAHKGKYHTVRPYQTPSPCQFMLWSRFLTLTGFENVFLRFIFSYLNHFSTFVMSRYRNGSILSCFRSISLLEFRSIKLVTIVHETPKNRSYLLKPSSHRSFQTVSFVISLVSSFPEWKRAFPPLAQNYFQDVFEAWVFLFFL